MNKYIAIDPNGQHHTRNSKTREYTHCVVARIDKTESERQILWSAEHDGKTNYAFYCNQGSCSPYRTYDGKPKTASVAGKDYVSSEEFQADFPTKQDYVDYLVAKAKAKLAARSDDYYNDYGSLGWCGRLDLAAKLAANNSNNPIYCDVQILESEVA